MIYGNMLIHFTELYRTVEYFTQEPKIAAGYKNKSEVKTTRIILQTDTGMSIKGTSGRLSGRNNWKIYDFSDDDTIWVPNNSPLKVGYYIKHPGNDYIYAVVKEAPWEYEGGFRIMKIEKVQGGITDSPLSITTGSY